MPSRTPSHKEPGGFPRATHSPPRFNPWAGIPVPNQMVPLRRNTRGGCDHAGLLRLRGDETAMWPEGTCEAGAWRACGQAAVRSPHAVTRCGDDPPAVSSGRCRRREVVDGRRPAYGGGVAAGGLVTLVGIRADLTVGGGYHFRRRAVFPCMVCASGGLQSENVCRVTRVGSRNPACGL